MKGLSIGYSPVRYSIDPQTGVRKLASVELWEISLVTFPANEAAQVTVVKQAMPVPAPAPRPVPVFRTPAPLEDAQQKAWNAAIRSGQVIELAALPF